MLTTIRSKATSLISYVLIGAICLSFALWGINSYFEGASQVDVASVNGDEISYEAYQNQLRSQQQRMRELFSNSLPDNFFETAQFKHQVVNQLINEMLVNQVIDDRRYTLNDAALAERIKTNEAFYTDGEFDPERYRRLLAGSNWTVQTFEQSQRRLGAFNQIEQALNRSYVLDDQELNDILKLQNQKRLAEYFVIESGSFEPEISAAEIQRQYEEYSNLYMTQEQIKVDYIELSAESLKDTQPLEDDELIAYFEENKGSFARPEVRRASHILIKPEDNNDEAEQLAIEQANTLIDRLAAGEDFAALAKAHSADKGSANNGGDLGVITPGVMVKPFEDAVFALNQGEVSEPVKSEFGYHLIKLTELTPEQVPAFAEIKDEIEEKIQNDQAVALFLEQAENFKNLAFESPQSLQPIADELGLEIKQSDWFTRSSGNDIATQAAVRNSAFSDIVLQDDLNGEVVELDDNKLIALRKRDYQPAEIKPLEEVKNNIETLLKSQKSKQMANQAGEKLLAELKEGTSSWQDIIDAGGYAKLGLADTRQAAQGINEEAISQAVFEQPRPKPGSPIHGSVSLSSGYALYQLTDVLDIEDAALGEIDDEVRLALTASLESRFGDESASSIMSALRDEADIQIFEENL